jgi:hypothetical protein
MYESSVARTPLLQRLITDLEPHSVLGALGRLTYVSAALQMWSAIPMDAWIIPESLASSRLLST